MKKTFIISVVLLSVLCSGSAWAEFKEGLWEITTKLELKGMPGLPGSMPPVTFRQCITKNDAIPKNTDKNYDCKTINQKVTGNTVSYLVECKGREGTMRTTGTATYTANSMTGSSTTGIKTQGQPEMQMTSKISGKYVGPCPK